MSATILVVEDEAPIRELITVNLRHAGYTVEPCADGAQALRAIGQQLPDAVLIDWMLPDIPGVELVRRLRAAPRTRELPIVLLTARAQETDKLAGFDAGADDYVTKPFSPRELIVRLRALLRRSSPSAGDEPLEIAGLRLDPRTHRVTGNGEPLELSPTEYKLLQFMMTQPDRVLTRSRLLDGVWGDHVFIEERTVDVHIRRLRKLLEPFGLEEMIKTVRSVGYRFSPQMQA